MRQEIKQNKRKQSAGKYILLFIIVIVIVSSTYVKDKVLRYLNNGDKRISIKNEIDLSCSGNGQALIYQNSILIYENNMIVSYNFEGKENWNKSIIYKTPILHIGNQYIYIGNKISGDISVLNRNGQTVWDYNCNQSITQMFEQNGMLVVFLESDDNLEKVIIIDGNGRVTFETVVENGIPMYANISKNGEKLAVSVLSISENKIKSKLALYSMDSKLVWDRDFENEIIKHVDFVKDNFIIVVTDSKLNFINYSGKLLWSRDIKGILCDIKIAKDRNCIIMLLDNGMQYFESISLEGRTEEKVEINGQVHKIYYNQGDIFLTGTNEIIGIRNNDIFLKYNTLEEIEHFNIYDNKVILITSGKIKVGTIERISD